MINKDLKTNESKKTNCNHINLISVKRINPSMYYGFEVSSRCSDCKCSFYHFRVEINYILELLADSLHNNMVTAEDLINSGWVYPVPNVKEAEDIIKNRFKFL